MKLVKELPKDGECVGYIRRKKTNEPSGTVFVEIESKIYVLENLVAGNIKGYAKVDNTDQDYAAVLRKNWIFFILSFLLIVLILFGISTAVWKNVLKVNRVVDNKVQLEFQDTREWDGTLPGEGSSSTEETGSIDIIGYPDQHLTQEKPFLLFINLESNTVNMVFTVLDEDGTQLYRSKYIAPGQMYEWDAYNGIPREECEVEIRIETFDTADNMPCNGTSQWVKIRK